MFDRYVILNRHQLNFVECAKLLPILSHMTMEHSLLSVHVHYTDIAMFTKLTGLFYVYKLL